MRFKSQQHKSTFKKAIRKKDKTDTRLMAAMYLLTADQILWNKVKGNIRESRIDYDEVRLDTVSENCYTLYSASKDMYFNTDHVSLSDIFGTKLISEKMYNVIITAINIRRLGLEKAEAIEYAIYIERNFPAITPLKHSTFLCRFRWRTRTAKISMSAVMEIMMILLVCSGLDSLNRHTVRWFEDEIQEAIDDYQSDIEMERYLCDDNDEIQRKLISAERGVETLNGELYGRTKLTLKEPLTAEETEQMRSEVTGQNSDGMASVLDRIEIGKYLLSIKGLGVVSLAMCLGETGDPMRFDDVRQMARLAGYNLVENSSGTNVSGTSISKRGRKNLRSVLYQISMSMVATNPEMKQLYEYLKPRKESPLKKLQALVVIGKKVLTLIFTLSKKKEYYEPAKLFGEVRKNQLCAA